MDLTLYQKMIGATNKSITDGYINDTITHVNEMFSSSPSYREVLVNGILSDCLISRKKSNKIDLLFRPRVIVDKGAYVTIGKDTFIILDCIDNEIYPKAYVELCNRSLRWKDDLGEIKDYKCLAKGTSYEEDDRRIVYNSDGELVVKVQYNDDTKTIKPQMRFIFDEKTYEVSTIALTDVYDGTGVLELIMKFSNATETDDKENQVADDSGNSGWGEW